MWTKPRNSRYLRAVSKEEHQPGVVAHACEHSIQQDECQAYLGYSPQNNKNLPLLNLGVFNHKGNQEKEAMHAWDIVPLNQAEGK